ncbi:unnamed protein product [Amoebophrya sp. A120]|nr:unnamed protein product [Amoebophrya sp. A120]|eukprot:GSA120T00010633001.1
MSGYNFEDEEPQSCPHCYSNDLTIDPFSGDLTCLGCGAVVQENRLVAEVGFQEGAGGKKQVVGQSITWGTGAQAISTATRGSRELTLAKAKKNVEGFASKLRIHNAHQEQALRIFGLALDKQFNRGRKSMLVCAACLYIVCRSNRSPHLLIDFSDACEFTVRDIGQTYIKLVAILQYDELVAVPIVDPSLFMERFAHKLDLGDRVSDVATTACRLVQQMKRDWLQEGRRPTGLCGAALLVACRWHQFERDPEDVAKVVMMAETTLRKRLYEMRQTTMAGMTRTEIMNADQNEPKISLCLPPCTKPKQKAATDSGLKALPVSDQSLTLAITQGERGKKDIKTKQPLMDKETAGVLLDSSSIGTTTSSDVEENNGDSSSQQRQKARPNEQIGGSSSSSSTGSRVNVNPLANNSAHDDEQIVDEEDDLFAVDNEAAGRAGDDPLTGGRNGANHGHPEVDQQSSDFRFQFPTGEGLEKMAPELKKLLMSEDEKKKSDIVLNNNLSFQRAAEDFYNSVEREENEKLLTGGHAGKNMKATTSTSLANGGVMNNPSSSTSATNNYNLNFLESDDLWQDASPDTSNFENAIEKADTRVLAEIVEESLSDVSCDEDCILDEEEQAKKKAVWNEVHKNELEDIHYRTLKRHNTRKRKALAAESQLKQLTDGAVEDGGENNNAWNDNEGEEDFFGGPNNGNAYSGIENNRKKKRKKQVVLGKKQEGKTWREMSRDHFHTSKAAESKYNLDEWDSLFE